VLPRVMNAYWWNAARAATGSATHSGPCPGISRQELSAGQCHTRPLAAGNRVCRVSDREKF
jgi:hypothetical protein